MEWLHVGARSTLMKRQASIVNPMTGRFARLWNEPDGQAPSICRNPRFDRQTVATQARKNRSRRFCENCHGELDGAWEPKIRAGTGWQADRELYRLDRIRTQIPEFAYPDARHVRSSWTSFLDQAHMDVAARRSFTLWLQSQFR